MTPEEMGRAREVLAILEGGIVNCTTIHLDDCRYLNAEGFKCDCVGADGIEILRKLVRQALCLEESGLVGVVEGWVEAIEMLYPFDENLVTRMQNDLKKALNKLREA